MKKTQWILALIVFSTSAFAADTKPKSADNGNVTLLKSSSIEKADVGSGEDWKGKPEQDHFTLGALTGLGTVNATTGFALMGTAATKVLDHGFIPEINNSVWAETQIGPVFAKGSTGFFFSVHMRWNFVKDDDWIFYALGGIAGDNTPTALGGKFSIYPRVGVGAVWRVFADFDVRGEVSHELIVVGPEFEF